MAIEKAMTPDWEKVVGDNWPEWDEEGYVGVSHGEVDAAGKASQGVAGVQQMSTTVDETMTGETADAAQGAYTLRSSNLGQRGEFHGNRAVSAGLMATNTANAKAQINAIAAEHQANVEQLKVRAVAQNMTQKEVKDEYDGFIDAASQAVNNVKQQHDDTHDALKTQFTEGGEPEVPHTMPGAPPGEGAPSLDLPSDVHDQVGNLMGTGGGAGGGMGGMDQLLGQGAGMAQGAMGQLGQLGQLGSHTPGSDVINPAIQQLGQLLGGASGGDQAQVTPEMLDQLLSGQDTGDSGSTGGDPDKGGTLASDVEPVDSSSDNKDDGDKPEHKADDKPEKASPAAQPVSAAPPASATVPGTQLSGDTSGGGSAMTTAPPPDQGTHLSGAGAATGAAVTGGGTPTPASSGAPLGSGAAMGMGMGMAAPARSQSSPRPAGALTRDITAGTPGQDRAQAQAGSVPEQPEQADTSAVVGATSTHGAPWVLSVVSAVSGEYHRAGFNTSLAVAQLADGTAVYCTSDGLGVIPRGVRLPENVIPLSEFPSLNELFRADWTGTSTPGSVLKLAADLELIPAITALYTTAHGDEGQLVTPDTLRGVEYLNTPITRDMFSGVSAGDAPLALESIVLTWGRDVNPVLAGAVQSLIASRDTTEALDALKDYMVSDADDCLRSGDVREAGYLLRQALYLPEQAPVG
jgi:hypothetical protein